MNWLAPAMVIVAMLTVTFLTLCTIGIRERRHPLGIALWGGLGAYGLAALVGMAGACLMRCP